MLHQARTLQNSRLVGLALKHLSVRTLHNSLQVGCQFHLLSCAVEYVDAFVVIEEQGIANIIHVIVKSAACHLLQLQQEMEIHMLFTP